MVAEWVAGLGAFKSMLDLAKGLKDLSDATARNAAVIELQTQILTAQEAQSSLVARVRELEEEVRGFERWDAEKERYELRQHPHANVMTYELKDGMQPAEPAHSICPDCYQQRIKSILQHVTRYPGMADVAQCQRCGWEAYISGGWHKDHGTRRR